MFRNHLKVSWRYISRHKLYSAINVLGLAFGICTCIVVYLITDFELGFDRFHPGKERIYRITEELQRSNGEKEFLNSLIPDVAGVQHQIPGFEAQAGFHLYSPNIKIQDGNSPEKKFDSRIEGSYSTSVIITWPEYFDVFKYEWLAGSPASLKEPFKVILSENKAHKYFGQLSPGQMIGKTVIYDDSLRATVSGIVKDWSGKTDFGYTDFISISSATNSFLKSQFPTDDWTSLSPHRSMAFVKLANGVTAEQINKEFGKYIKEHVKKANDGSLLTMQLQPLTDIHFSKDFHRGDDGDDFRKPYLPTLYVLIGVAIFILLLAAINFINLSTAKSIQRTKEIGVRKIVGGTKTNITIQFLTETLLLTLFAVILAALLANPVLAAFGSYIPQGVRFSIGDNSTMLFLLTVTIVTTLLAGIYPSRILATHLPALSLKGTTGFNKGHDVSLRKALIVFQFTISLVFIIGAMVMRNQINYMNNSYKGFNSDAILTINHWRDKGALKVFARNIANITGIKQAILQGNSPMGFAHGFQDIQFKDQDKVLNMRVSLDGGDDNYIPFYEIKIVAGRNMIKSDSMNELVINETCAKAMGFDNSQNAIGKTLYFHDRPYPIAGVVADFHEGSFHEEIKPVAIAKDREWSVAIKLTTEANKISNVKAILSELEKQWKKVFPDEGFNYSFYKESIARLYEQETKTAWLMNTATIITIFISCMGLFGLALFTTERRIREIGIRKVLGASVLDITGMLTKDFTILVLIAILISSPIAWYFMNQWLQDFVYRVDIAWWVFLLAGSVAIFIALLTICVHAIRAALGNPVKSLRTE
jgi:putative ABC transport system permease protein